MMLNVVRGIFVKDTGKTLSLTRNQQDIGTTATPSEGTASLSFKKIFTALCIVPLQSESPGGNAHLVHRYVFLKCPHPRLRQTTQTETNNCNSVRYTLDVCGWGQKQSAGIYIAKYTITQITGYKQTAKTTLAVTNEETVSHMICYVLI